MMGDLDDILGAEPGPVPDPSKRNRLLAMGDKLLKKLKPYADVVAADDELLTLKELCRALERFKWAPKTTKSMGTRLWRADVKPAVIGSRGRGKGARYRLSEVRKALKPRRRKSR